MSEERHMWYLTVLEDLDNIKERSNKEDPILVLSDDNWMYLHLDRPVGIFTTWGQALNKIEVISEYYKANSDRVPKYIYVPKSEQDGKLGSIYEDNEALIIKMFDYTEEELPGGLLLTVTDYKLDNANE